MSTMLAPPGAALATRILAKCPYEDRLPAGRFTPRMGIMRGTLNSLVELHLYLAPDDRTLPAVNLERLAGWIEWVIGDPDLGRGAEAAAQGAGSYVDACIAVHALVGQRLDQARSVLGILDEPANPGAEVRS
jgi:hypothetical protein